MDDIFLDIPIRLNDDTELFIKNLRRGPSVGSSVDFFGNIVDPTDIKIGCLQIKISHTATSIWANQNEMGNTQEETYEILNGLFYTLFSSIKLSAKLEHLQSLLADNKCLTVNIVTGTDKDEPVKYDENVSELVVRSFDSPKQILKKTVYNKRENEAIRNLLLQIAYYEFHKNTDTYIDTSVAPNILLLPINKVMPQLVYLVNKQLLKIPNNDNPSSPSFFKISGLGIDHFEQNSEFEELKSSIHIGDVINASSTGDNSPILINSNVKNMVLNKLDELEVEVNKHADDKLKVELISLVEEIRQLGDINTERERNSALSIAGKILSTSADIGGVSMIVAEIIKLLT